MSHNTWIHKIARATIVRPLARTSVTPNQVTTVRIVAGVGAAMALAHGSVEWANYGAVLFILSMLLDRADGDLARMTGRTSPGGHTYDLFADALCNALIFVGLGIGLRASEFGLWSIPMGILAGAAVATILMLVIRIEGLQGARAAEIGGIFGFDPDDAMLAIPIAVLLGWSEGLLVAATIGAPAFALFFLFLFRKLLRSGPAS
ncbi:MAG: CDP-alcohol phosphatidyltransferase family protein [Rhodospirillales bacterium]|nr:CDP-alcohol phosphatidyltransferase family protein [Rhodospirillales bacterium]MBO6788815.1 CDP-alcohol phosphatidyltransferase family protein [Rhodospirillales bacterium]